MAQAGGDAAEQRPGSLYVARRLGPSGRRAAAQDCSGRRSPPKTRAARVNEQPLPPSFHGGKLKYLVGESWEPSDGVSTLDIEPHVTL